MSTISGMLIGATIAIKHSIKFLEELKANKY